MLNSMSPSIVRAQSSNDCQGHGPLEVPLLPQGPVCKADPISYVPLQSCFHKTVGVVCVKHESDWIILWLQTLQWGPTTYQGLGDTAGSGPICQSLQPPCFLTLGSLEVWLLPSDLPFPFLPSPFPKHLDYSRCSVVLSWR